MYFLIYTLALYENMLDMLKVFNIIFIISTSVGIVGIVFFVPFHIFPEEFPKPNNNILATIKQVLPKFRTYCFMMIGLVFLNIVLPKPIYMYTMTGVYVGEQLKENTQVTSLFSKSVEALELRLDKTIKELTEETKKEPK